ncbi:MAG: hypothetical protein ABL931_22120, partial [Usitatibacteraceae bacterium]
MQNKLLAAEEIGALEIVASRAMKAGRDQEALAAWSRILAIDPKHGRTLSALGQHAFRTGDLESARIA